MSNIFHKGLQTGINLIKHPAEIKLVNHSNKVWRNKFESKYAGKSGLPVVSIQQFLETGIQEVNPYFFLGDGSTIMDLLLLNNLVASIENARYFEIGVWRGESILNATQYAQESVGLDLPDEHYLKDENLAGLVLERNERLDRNKKITRLEGNSIEFDFSSVEGKFDVIFIDGNHAYDFVVSDTKNVFQHLLKKDGVVVWHDYGFTPEEIRYEVFMGILGGLPEKEHAFLYHVSHTKCAIWTRREIDLSTNQKQQFPMLGTLPFGVKIELP